MAIEWDDTPDSVPYPTGARRYTLSDLAATRTAYWFDPDSEQFWTTADILDDFHMREAVDMGYVHLAPCDYVGASDTVHGR